MSADWLGLEGRLIVVTGAGRGFGRAVAKAYARAGATVITVDPDVEAASSAAAEVEALSGGGISIRGDMSVVTDVSATFEKIENLFGLLDGIVHVTSADSKTPFMDVSEGEWFDLLNNDVKSSLYMLQQGLRYLNGGGFVTVLLPPTSYDGPHVMAIRGALRGLIEGSSKYFAQGVRVNGVVPSRDPSKEPLDIALVHAALSVGSALGDGINGQIVQVMLPAAEHDDYEFLRDLP